MKRLVLEHLLAAAREYSPVALVTRLDSGEQHLVFLSRAIDERGDKCDSAASFIEPARRALAEDRNTFFHVGGVDIAVRIIGPRPRLVLVGAVHISQVLHQMAALVGFEVLIVDPRPAFASDERFPGAAIRCEWPEEAFAQETLGSRSAVVTLTHDPKIDDPALAIALRSNPFYIGALGSRRTHEARKIRLTESGIAADDVEKIHAPVGLPLGGRAPAEIATSVLAEIIQTRYQVVS